jgi:hypothetical protein
MTTGKESAIEIAAAGYEKGASARPGKTNSTETSVVGPFKPEDAHMPAGDQPFGAKAALSYLPRGSAALRGWSARRERSLATSRGAASTLRRRKKCAN